MKAHPSVAHALLSVPLGCASTLVLFGCLVERAELEARLSGIEGKGGSRRPTVFGRCRFSGRESSAMPYSLSLSLSVPPLSSSFMVSSSPIPLLSSPAWLSTHSPRIHLMATKQAGEVSFLGLNALLSLLNGPH